MIHSLRLLVHDLEGIRNPSSDLAHTVRVLATTSAFGDTLVWSWSRHVWAYQGIIRLAQLEWTRAFPSLAIRHILLRICAVCVATSKSTRNLFSLVPIDFEGHVGHRLHLLLLLLLRRSRRIVQVIFLLVLVLLCVVSDVLHHINIWRLIHTVHSQSPTNWFVGLRISIIFFGSSGGRSFGLCQFARHPFLLALNGILEVLSTKVERLVVRKKR